MPAYVSRNASTPNYQAKPRVPFAAMSNSSGIAHFFAVKIMSDRSFKCAVLNACRQSSHRCVSGDLQTKRVKNRDWIFGGQFCLR